MTSTPINIVSAPGSTTADTLRTALNKINTNLTAIDSALTLKADTATIPNKLSSLTNDVGYYKSGSAASLLRASVSNPGDAILDLEATGVGTNRFRLKQIFSSPNVGSGDQWLFRAVRPSDGAVRDVVLDGTDGGYLLTTSASFVVPHRNVMASRHIPSWINTIYIAGYADENDGGGAWYRRTTNEWTHGQVTDANGGVWVLANPTGVPVDAFGATRFNSDCTAAFQRAANTGVINLLGRDYSLVGPVTTGGQQGTNLPTAIVIRGADPHLSRILHTGTGDCFQHGLLWDSSAGTSYPPMQSPFTAENVAFVASAGNSLSSSGFRGSAFAINLRQNGNWGVFNLTNVRFHAFDGRSAWGGFINAQGATNTNFYNVWAEGGSYDTTALGLSRNTQIGFQFTCPDLTNVSNYDARAKYKSYVFNFTNCTVAAVTHAVKFWCQGTNSTLEGAIFTNCGGRSVKGAWFNLVVEDYPNWMPPYFVFDKCNMQGPGQLFHIDSCSEFHMKDCLMYLDPNGFGPSGANYIEIINCRQAYISDNSFIMLNGSHVNSIFAFGDNSRNVKIKYNHFEFDTNISAQNANFGGNNFLWCASNCTNMKAHYNDYVRDSAGQTNNMLNTNGPWSVL